MSDEPTPQKTDIYIDASAMKKTYCTRAYQLVCLQGYRPAAARGPLVFGKAVHMFAHARALNVSVEDAMRKSNDYYVNAMAPDLTEAGKLIGAMASHMGAMYGRLLTPAQPELSVERFFKVLVWEDEQFRIFLVGTIDRLAIVDDTDTLVAFDYKTSRKWDKNKIFEEYTTSVQFLFYYYVISKWPEAVVPADYVHYIHERRFCVCPSPVLLSNQPSPKWIRGPMLRFDAQLDEFAGELSTTINTVLAMSQAGLGTEAAPLAAPTGMVSDMCPKCEFKAVCFRPPGVEPRAVLSALYTQERYDPSKF